jgi:hypothetical protein
MEVSELIQALIMFVNEKNFVTQFILPTIIVPIMLGLVTNMLSDSLKFLVCKTAKFYFAKKDEELKREFSKNLRIVSDWKNGNRSRMKDLTTSLVRLSFLVFCCIAFSMNTVFFFYALQFSLDMDDKTHAYFYGTQSVIAMLFCLLLTISFSRICFRETVGIYERQTIFNQYKNYIQK